VETSAAEARGRVGSAVRAAHPVAAVTHNTVAAIGGEKIDRRVVTGLRHRTAPRCGVFFGLDPTHDDDRDPATFAHRVTRDGEENRSVSRQKRRSLWHQKELCGRFCA
jgi:hypothetical protein